jgi:hypothetical protein
MTERSLTPKQEKFCQVFIETGNASEAYRQVYNCTNMKPESINRMAKENMDNLKIASRVSELREEHKKRHDFTIDDAVREYDEAREIARMKFDASPMISATSKKVDLYGLEAPKKVNIEGTLGEWIESLQKSNEGK